MSLAEYYRTCAIPKGIPRAVTKIQAQRAAKAEERACRIAVDRRDRRRCFFPSCKVRASEKHHIRPRSLGGAWIPANILSACGTHHSWFKAGLIRIVGNPDRGPVKVTLTAIGRDAEIIVPRRT